MSLIVNKRRISKGSLYIIPLFTFILIVVIYSKYIGIFHYNNHVLLNYTSKYPYVALIVDNRATELLINAVNNVIKHIPDDWKVQIMTPYEHWTFYNQSSLSILIKTNRVFLTPLEQLQNNLPGDKYINSILTSPSFWHKVQGNKVLFFQIDSVLCSNSLYNLTDFLQYDFIGAPWYIGGCCNGGLSLRSRTKILQMLENGYVYYPLFDVNEDGWFTKNLRYFNSRIAPVHIAKQFAVETIYHPRPFGVHKPHVNRIGLENMKRLCNECPELATIDPYCQSTTHVSVSS